MRLLRVLFAAFFEAKRQVLGGIEEGDSSAKELPSARGIAGQACNDTRAEGGL